MRGNNKSGKKTVPSTATPRKKHWEHATLTTSVSLSPVPTRTIVVQVYGDTKFIRGSWHDVIGYLCVIETEYHYSYAQGEPVHKRGTTHDEMLELGWHPTDIPKYAVLPVITNDEECLTQVLENKVFDDRDEHNYGRGRRIVPCFWPPEDDRKHAELIALELLDDPCSSYHNFSVKLKKS
jgi:hypothetical protein